MVEEKLQSGAREAEAARHAYYKKLKQKRVQQIVLSLSLAVFLLISLSIYLEYQVYSLKKLETFKEKTQETTPQTPAEIMEAVSHHIILPTGTPQVAAVQDAAKLSTTQAFFKDAQNGDVVIVYDTMILLYRPATDILVAIGDITVPAK
jgi:hypothetical protein